MFRLSDRLNDLNKIPPDIAWKLLDILFQQTASVVFGALIFVLLGLIGFFGIGSFWYLGGSIIAGAICVFRLRQAHAYAASPDRADLGTWRRRNMLVGWMTAASWGAWSAVVLFESHKRSLSW